MRSDLKVVHTMDSQLELILKLLDVCRAVLQAVVLLFALGTFALGQFHRFRISTCCLLAVTTVLFCDASQTFYYCKPLRVPEHTFAAIWLTHMYLPCLALHSDMSIGAVHLFC